MSALNNLLYALTLLVVSLPVYLFDTVEIASASAIIWLQGQKIVIRNYNALERLAFCKDLCIQVNQDTTDSPFRALTESHVNVPVPL